MTAMNMIQALNSAMDVMLERDANVLIFGEDVGFFGGVFRVTDGLQQRHGGQRVFDAPIAESGQIAVAIGMGAYGLRPVVECQFADYIYPAFDQLVSEAARLRIGRRGSSMHRLRCGHPMAAASSAARPTARVRKACSPMSVASRQ